MNNHLMNTKMADYAKALADLKKQNIYPAGLLAYAMALDAMEQAEQMTEEDGMAVTAREVLDHDRDASMDDYDDFINGTFDDAVDFLNMIEAQGE